MMGLTSQPPLAANAVAQTSQLGTVVAAVIAAVAVALVAAAVIVGVAGVAVA